MAGRPRTGNGAAAKLGGKRVTMMELVKHEVDRRGYPGLMEWAEEHPTEFWTKLAARLLPRVVEMDARVQQTGQVEAPPDFQTMEEWNAYLNKKRAAG